MEVVSVKGLTIFFSFPVDYNSFQTEFWNKYYTKCKSYLNIDLTEVFDLKAFGIKQCSNLCPSLS